MNLKCAFMFYWLANASFLFPQNTKIFSELFNYGVTVWDRKASVMNEWMNEWINQSIMNMDSR